MEFYYNYVDLMKVQMPPDDSSISYASVSSILGTPAVDELIECTNANPEELITEIFAEPPHCAKPLDVATKVRDYILDNGFLYACGARDYPPYLEWCEKCGVTEPYDGLIDTFGPYMNVTIGKLVESVDLIRKELL